MNLKYNNLFLLTLWICLLIPYPTVLISTKSLPFLHHQSSQSQAMPLDSDTFAAIALAVKEGVAESNKYQAELVKENLTESSKHQAELVAHMGALQTGMDSMQKSMLKEQEAFEAKSDLKLNNLETTLTTRQETIDKENKSKLCDLQDQISNLAKIVDTRLPPANPVIASGHAPPPGSQQAPVPPHPALLPQPTFASVTQPRIAMQKPNVVSEKDLETIKSIAAFLTCLHASHWFR